MGLEPPRVAGHQPAAVRRSWRHRPANGTRPPAGNRPRPIGNAGEPAAPPLCEHRTKEGAAHIAPMNSRGRGSSPDQEPSRAPTKARARTLRS